MDEQDILARIHAMVAEEHALRDQSPESGLGENARTRLTELELALDQCWDLLRQRRARAEFGEDPDAARPRPVGEVEDYLQ